MASKTGGLQDLLGTDQVASANLGSIHDQLLNGGVGEIGSVFGLNTDLVASNLGANDVAVGAHGPLTFAGLGGVTTETILASQTIQPNGGVALHFADGSSINVLGATHIDGSFFQA